MACKSCKKTNSEIYNETVDKRQQTPIKAFHYIARFLIFILLSIVIVPLIIPITIYALFITTVSNKGINLVPALVYLGRKLFRNTEYEDNEDEFDGEEDGGDDFENDEDYDELLDVEYEPINPNEITIVK